MDLNASMEVREYDTMDECVQAVINKQADCTFGYNYTSELYVREDIRSQLSYTPLQNMSTNFTVAVRRDKGKVLYQLMNKIANSISNDEVQPIIDKNMEFWNNKDDTLLAYFYKNPVRLGILLIILAVIVLVMVFLFCRARDAKREKTQRQALEAQMNIMKSLTNIYLSAYYVDINEDLITEISSKSHVNDIVGLNKKAFAVLKKTAMEVVSDEYIDSVIEFLDFSTIQERMGDSALINKEFVANKIGWCRANFIAVDRNESGNMNHVVFAVQIIDEEKKRELDYQRRLAQSVEEANQAN